MLGRILVELEQHVGVVDDGLVGVTIARAYPESGDDPPTIGWRPIPLVTGYEVVREIGRGGFGVVYEARQLRLNRPCALKMILAGDHASPETAVRFLGEAEAVARLAA